MLFWKSLLLGLAVAAPLGPIGALCINRTLDRGFRAGVAGGLGTALADALYASLAAAGFAAFASLLARVQLPLMVAGGLFLLWLGAQSLRPRPARPAAQVGARDLLGTTAATFALTMANPMTILSFAALFAGLGLAAAAGPGAAMLVVAGVFCGSMLWWVLLSGGVALARHRLPPAFALWTARASGAVLIGFAVWALVSAARTAWAA
ncbi:LysE family translocator [Rhodobacter sp. Har01]|uniref:LysE family translocator n=1 Tax=Rhodobacter sp. Har01 TaxID=2883999 RepID=UPI001D064AC0|nr:LysE family transporter [Rhodobacter sp. Har01]MCB6177504.1 LysE family translocator [Rhodobacter sp. Har01]